MRIRHLALFFCLLPGLQLAAQDTLKVTIHQADSLLITRSLALVVKQYDIDQAEADRIQAKLFNNPSIATEWSIRPSTGHFFDVAQPNGQKAVTVEQLFRIGGQRSLAVRTAEQRKKVTQAEYAELAASLRVQLHNALYQQYFAQRSIAAISSQLGLLNNLQKAYGEQFDKGNVSLKEATRLRTAFFALNQQRINLRQQVIAQQQLLRQLLAETRPVLAVPTPTELVEPIAIPLPTDTLIARALRQRPAALAAQAAMAAGEINLKLQRRMAVPDLSLGATYDQNSNYLPNYTGLNAGISIPIFDRNQGNIARAKAASEQAKAEARQTGISIQSDVQQALDNIQVLRNQLEATNPGFYEQLDQLSESLVTNYVKNNIPLIEFTDLFDSYNTTIIALNQLKADLQNAYDELEFATGQRLFPR